MKNKTVVVRKLSIPEYVAELKTNINKFSLMVGESKQTMNARINSNWEVHIRDGTPYFYSPKRRKLVLMHEA